MVDGMRWCEGRRGGVEGVAILERSSNWNQKDVSLLSLSPPPRWVVISFTAPCNVCWIWFVWQWSKGSWWNRNEDVKMRWASAGKIFNFLFCPLSLLLPSVCICRFRHQLEVCFYVQLLSHGRCNGYSSSHQRRVIESRSDAWVDFL